MSTIYVDADTWDALDPEERAVALEAAQTPVVLGDPAEQVGTFDMDGMFTPDETGARWYCWDDHRLTEEHAVALGAAL